MNTKKIVCQGWKRINKVTVPSMVTGFLAQMSIASADMPWEGPLSEIRHQSRGLWLPVFARLSLSSPVLRSPAAKVAELEEGCCRESAVWRLH